MDIILKILQVILALSVLILVHELGHFTMAKIFRIRVEKFYLFFDAGFAIFKFKPKHSDTEYGLGWLPLGGYCKIAGMIDESMDTGHLKQEPQPWEFRSRPAWQRFLVMSGGVLFNFIFAIILYIGILAGWGESYISNEDNKTTTYMSMNSHTKWGSAPETGYSCSMTMSRTISQCSRPILQEDQCKRPLYSETVIP